jgi:mono/diheme cytochrome c family protein
MKKLLIKIVPVMAVAMMLSSCFKDAKQPGSIYMPDMTYSNAYETYSTSEITTPEGNNMSARKPVEGTIPRGWIPADEKIRTNEAFLMSYMAKNHFTHDAAKWQEEYDRAAVSIKNPWPSSPELVAEGKKIYEINCKVCHGEKGEGNGQIVELPGGGDGPYTARPPAYATRLPQINDGNMFYSVSYGKGMMGGYGFQLSVEERWKVISYIKSLAGIKDGAAPVAAMDSAKVTK